MRTRSLTMTAAAAALLLIAGCGSSGSAESSGGTLDQEGACAAWADFLNSPDSATPTAPTALESDQFMALSNDYQRMADALSRIVNDLGEGVELSLSDQLGKAAQSAGQVATLAASVAETLSTEELEAMIPVNDELSGHIVAITDICTA